MVPGHCTLKIFLLWWRSEDIVLGSLWHFWPVPAEGDGGGDNVLEERETLVLHVCG